MKGTNAVIGQNSGSSASAPPLAVQSKQRAERLREILPGRVNKSHAADSFRTTATILQVGEQLSGHGVPQRLAQRQKRTDILYADFASPTRACLGGGAQYRG